METGIVFAQMDGHMMGHHWFWAANGIFLLLLILAAALGIALMLGWSARRRT